MGYRRTRSLVRSRDFLARAYASAPDRVETLVEYQRACLWLGQTDEALPLAQRQVQRTGGNADSRSNLAITLLLHGDVDGAATEAAAAVDRAPDDIVIQRVRALVADVRDGRRVRPRSLLELETPAVPPVGAALLPEEAQRAFDDAFAAYRTVLQADPGRILTSEERAGLEQSIGPISRVEIAATAVQLNWLGRTLRPRLTERTTVVGANGTVWREGRLQMLIEERDGAWRVVQSRLLPLLRPPETVADPVVVPEGVRLPN